MFSNEVNTRDLFFSNPMDVFLGQDHSNKTKYESGISSSFSGYNQTGNSADLRCRSSQDLFSPFDKTDSQFETNEILCTQASNSGYQKYISQNLLLGKDRSPKSIFSLRDDEVKKVKKSVSPKIENEAKEIRQSLDALNESVKQLNSETGLHSNKVNYLQETVSKLTEKVTSVEDSIGKKIETIDENYKAILKLIRKDLLDRISEANKNVSKVENKLDDYAEQSEKILQEVIQNISKSHDVINKKQLQNMQTLFNKIDESTKTITTTLYASAKDIKTSFEKTSEENMQCLKNYISNSMKKLDLSPAIQVGNSLVQEKIKSPQQSLYVLQNKIYARRSSITPENCNSNSNYQNNGTRMQKNSKTVHQNHSKQTPLAYYVNTHGKCNRENFKRNLITRSNDTPEIPVYKDGFCMPNINIRRKVSTPLANTISPVQAKIRQRRSPYCMPVIKRRNTSTMNNSFLQKNTTNFLQANKGLNKCDKIEPSLNSSPGFSVYQATMLTKGYATHLW